MGSRMPRVTVRELLRALRRDGWVESRRRGSHVQLTHPKKSGTVTVPIHASKTIPLEVLSSVLHQAELSVQDFMDLL